MDTEAGLSVTVELVDLAIKVATLFISATIVG